MDPEIEFFEKDCAWVELPGMDPLKLTGVMVDLTSGGEDVINHGMYANPSADEQRRCAFYSPIADPTPDSIGRIIKVGRPAALVGMYSYDSAFQSEEEGSTTKTEDRTDGDPEKKYAYAVYYCTARSMVKTAAEFRLMFRSGGNLIVPGVSCTFNSKEGVVYYGYITSVTHNLTTSGQCTTTVNYSYVRSEKDYPGISVPMENPAYE